MGPRRRSVAWADAARQQLDEALAYVAEDSPSAAAELLQRLLTASASLHSAVIVLALLHQRQDFTKWAERDPRRSDAP